MKTTKFSEQQIAFILRQAEEGTTVGDGKSEFPASNGPKKWWQVTAMEMDDEEDAVFPHQRLSWRFQPGR